MKLIPKVREPVFVVQLNAPLSASKGDLILVFDKEGTDYQHLTQAQVSAIYRVARVDEQPAKSAKTTKQPSVARKSRRLRIVLNGATPTTSFNVGGGATVGARAVCALAVLHDQQHKLSRALSSPELTIAIHDAYPKWSPSVQNVASMLSVAFKKKYVARTKSGDDRQVFHYSLTAHGQNIVTRFRERANEFLQQHPAQKE